MSRIRGSPGDPTSWFTLLTGGTNTLQSVLDTLSEREAGVITLRFGIIDGQPKTLDQIARIYGITPQRVREIESKTMSKLRHPARSEFLAVKDGNEWVGVIDALFGRHTPSSDDLVVCSYCHECWFNPHSGVFTGGRSRKYCSDKCRQAAYRARRRKTEAYS